MTLITEKNKPNLVFRSQYDRFGNSFGEKENIKKITNKTNDYYKKDLNMKWGIAELVALFEAFSGAVVVFFLPSAATVTNALTSCGEYGQVLIARTKSLGDTSAPDENSSLDELKKTNDRIKQAESRREGAMAFMQLGAGTLGAMSNVLDFVKGSTKDVQDLSVFKKVGLSAASFISSVSMFLGWGEKSIMSSISKGGPESENMSMNAASDFRCFLEWSAMTVYPWIRGFKLARKGLDILIPYLAIREGLKHFIHEGISKVINNDVLDFKKCFGEKITNVLKFVFQIKDNKNKGIPHLFFLNWFLGGKKGDGFRSKVLLNILRAFKCNAPECWLENDKLAVEYPLTEQLRPEGRTVKSDSTAPSQKVQTDPQLFKNKTPLGAVTL